MYYTSKLKMVHTHTYFPYSVKYDIYDTLQKKNMDQTISHQQDENEKLVSHHENLVDAVNGEEMPNNVEISPLQCL